MKLVIVIIHPNNIWFTTHGLGCYMSEHPHRTQLLVAGKAKHQKARGKGTANPERENPWGDQDNQSDKPGTARRQILRLRRNTEANANLSVVDLTNTPQLAEAKLWKGARRFNSTVRSLYVF